MLSTLQFSPLARRKHTLLSATLMPEHRASHWEIPLQVSEALGFPKDDTLGYGQRETPPLNPWGQWNTTQSHTAFQNTPAILPSFMASGEETDLKVLEAGILPASSSSVRRSFSCPELAKGTCSSPEAKLRIRPLLGLPPPRSVPSPHPTLPRGHRPMPQALLSEVW